KNDFRAIHEAGHAVISWLVGLDVESVRLVNGSGLVAHPDGLFRRYQKSGRADEWQHKHAAVAIGGLIAEDLCLRMQEGLSRGAALLRHPGQFFAWAKAVQPAVASGLQSDLASVARYSRASNQGKVATEARAYKLFRRVHAVVTNEYVWPA